MRNSSLEGEATTRMFGGGLSLKPTDKFIHISNGDILRWHRVYRNGKPVGHTKRHASRAEYNNR